MEEISEKDRKILIELDKNAREADSKIAEKIRLSKQVTNYRIKNLVEKGIIKNFYTIVNVGKLGFSSYYVFLQLKNINEQEEERLLEKIKNKPYVGWLVNGTGRWDLVLLIYAKSHSGFDNNLNEILRISANKVHEYSFTTLISAEHIGYKLFGQKEHKSTVQTEKEEKIELDKTDKKILQTISQDSRLSVVEISELAKIPLHVVRYRLKEMIKNKIIEGFKPKISVGKLGYQWHLLLIRFSALEEKRKHEFIQFCNSKKEIYYLTKTIGTYNLMLDIHAKSSEDFKKILSEIKEKFSDVINRYESIIIFDEYKIDYFTDLFAD